MSRKESPVSRRRVSSEKASWFERTDTEEEKPPKPIREKRTYHLPTDTVLLLNELQLEQHRSTGKKPELSDLVSEAIQLLAESRKKGS